MKLFADKGYARKGWGARAYLFHAPNYRMTELVGAVGLVQLEKVQASSRSGVSSARQLTACCRGIDGVEPAPVTPGAKHSYWLYPMRVDGVSAEALAAEMIEQKIWVLGRVHRQADLPLLRIADRKEDLRRFRVAVHDQPGRHLRIPRGPVSDCRRGACSTWSAFRSTRVASLDYVERVASVVASSAVAKLSGACERGDGCGGAGSTAADRRGGHPSQRGTRAGNATPKVRIGIVGCGQMGRWHLDSYRANPDVELVGFVDTLARSGRAVRRANAAAAPIASHRELLANERLDGVSLCTVPSTSSGHHHRPAARLACTCCAKSRWRSP